MTEYIALSAVVPKAAGEDAIWRAAVLELTPNAQTNALLIKVLSEAVLNATDIELAEKAVAQAYSMKSVKIEVCYKFTEIGQIEVEFIKELLMQRYPSVKSALGHGKTEYDGLALLIYVTEEWLFRVEDLKNDMERLISQTCGRHIPLEVHTTDFKGESFQELRQKAMEQATREMAEEQARMPAKPKPVEKPKPFERRFDPDAVRYKPQDAGDNTIYGKVVTRELVKIADVSADSGKVTVSGDIYFTEFRKLGGKGKTVLTFELNDKTGSVRVNKVMPDEEAELVKANLEKGIAVTVQGTAMWSKFDNDTIISPSAIVKAEKKVRRDTSDKKRVELHLHTNMSAMDSVCDTGSVLRLAASMGHRAVAITDHGVAQAFPDAMNTVAKLKKKYPEFKAIYGIEAYCLNDLVKKGPVKGYTDTEINGEIIVFDLETTGLRPTSCEIIEVAAVLVKGGEIKDTFHTYVNPKRSIPYEITSLTGIKDDMVADAPEITQVLPMFLAFCGDRPLCAHNADFDISFIRAACERLGIARSFCSIDTVELARVLMPGLKKHKLNVIAEEFGFDFNHHRAIDDTNVLAQIFFRFAEMLRKRCEISLVSEINGAVQALREGGDIKNRERTNHLVILVKDYEGLYGLYKMISLAHLKYYKKVPIIPMSLIMEYREHLILGSACEAGELFGAIVDGKPQSDIVKIAKQFDYLEIQPIGNNRFMVEKGIAKDEEELKSFNRAIVRLGDSLNIPVCATGDVHFIEPDDAIFREILMASKGFDDAGRQAPLYYRTTEEMLKEFEYLGRDKAVEVVVENTNKIADMCGELKPVPDGTYPPSIENSAQEIEGMARKRVKELYGENPPKIVMDRLELELDSIIKHGFDVMYIIAQKLVAKSLEAGYLVGSRGSVGSSFVAYLTGITEVNALSPHYRCEKCYYSEFYEGVEYATGVDLPDKNCPHCGEKLYKDGFGIPFATFLGFEGDKAPDIDLNFSGEYQSQAHRETIKLFGEGNVYKAGTIGTVKDKTAYGFVKKRLDETGKIVNRAEENRLVQGCTGVKRTTGQHPGGLIVVPNGRTIYEFCPVQHPADDPDSDIVTTHFDYHSIHDNLLKLDLLGHDDPTMIRHLQDLSGLNPTKIPLDDKKTMSIFTSLESLSIEGDEILGYFAGAAAIPEFGTKFVRGMLEDTKPTTFDELLRISGLSHGTDVWLNNAKDIILEGKATLKNVICVRDDITTYLMQVGLAPKLSFTISESVRKGKGLKPEWEEEMTSHDVPEWYIESCKKIQYMFPRAHAVAYVMMAYRIAWFKVHRPLDFYSAYFSIRANAFDAGIMCRGDSLVTDKYMSLKKQDKRTAIEEDMMVTLEVVHEFYKRGFTFAPLDVYISGVSGFKIEGNSLIPPLTSLPGVGETAAQSIVLNRDRGRFMSVEDMILRCDKVSKGVAESLSNAGALGNLPKSNQLDLFGGMI